MQVDESVPIKVGDSVPDGVVVVDGGAACIVHDAAVSIFQVSRGVELSSALGKIWRM